MCLFGGLQKKDSATENGNFENSKSHKLKMRHRDRHFLQKKFKQEHFNRLALIIYKFTTSYKSYNIQTIKINIPTLIRQQRYDFDSTTRLQAGLCLLQCFTWHSLKEITIKQIQSLCCLLERKVSQRFPFRS